MECRREYATNGISYEWQSGEKVFGGRYSLCGDISQFWFEFEYRLIKCNRIKCVHCFYAFTWMVRRLVRFLSSFTYGLASRVWVCLSQLSQSAAVTHKWKLSFRFTVAPCVAIDSLIYPLGETRHSIISTSIGPNSFNRCCRPYAVKLHGRQRRKSSSETGRALKNLFHWMHWRVCDAAFAARTGFSVHIWCTASPRQPIVNYPHVCVWLICNNNNRS